MWPFAGSTVSMQGRVSQPMPQTNGLFNCSHRKALISTLGERSVCDAGSQVTPCGRLGVAGPVLPPTQRPAWGPWASADLELGATVGAVSVLVLSRASEDTASPLHVLSTVPRAMGTLRARLEELNGLGTNWFVSGRFQGRQMTPDTACVGFT